MTTYIVTFEVSSKETRQDLRALMKKYNGYCPIHKYCWAIRSKDKATHIRDNLSQVLQPGDRIFVIRSGTEAAWRNAYGEENTAWLKKSL